ncbi:MAG: hypothetical protein E2581_17315 [Pseudomonas sp.]|uniref:hypothetical protein n=1 Tax=Pseudomonas sp. TaxID=306 RepID=UPI001D1F9D63|nr:hypothetical protein [Pseudomonas sp.]MPT00242.1 hypothetical protein [Pseudomonas sp.]
MQTEDLLEGKVPPAKAKSLDKGIKELEQFLNLRQSVFSSAIALATLLYLTAIALSGILVFMLPGNKDIHWHASLLVAAFVIPPTVLLLSLMKGVFKSTPEEKDETGIPTVDVSKDFIKEVFKKGLDAVSKTEK